MIKTQELVKRYQKWYIENKESIQSAEVEANNAISSFLDRFGTEEKLRAMDLVNDYAFEAGSKRPTFCYQIDFGTDILGINRCSFQSGYQRYGIQLKSNGEWLPFCKTNSDRKFCEEQAKRTYKKYLEETIRLLKATQDGDFETIKSIEMPKPHLNKLHFIFSGGKSINIYVHPDLDKLFKLFNIPIDKQDDVFDKRQKLLDFMNKTFRGTHITPWLFCRFLYSPIGLRPEWKQKKFIIKTLSENVRSKSINIKTHVREYNSISETTNDGKDAEDLFYEFLLTNPEQFNILDKSKIKRIHISPETGIHCDFSYETRDGKIVYVEVKSSFKKDGNKPHFLMSDYEFEFMLQNELNYVLYYLADAKHNKNCFIKLTPKELKSLCRAKQYIFDVE